MRMIRNNIPQVFIPIVAGMGNASRKAPKWSHQTVPDQVFASPLPCRRVIIERRNTLLKRSWQLDDTCSMSVELTRRIVTSPSACMEACRFAPRT